MTNDYDFMFKYLNKATKEERHIDEMETFAKKHPLLFAKCHFLFRPIVSSSEGSKDFMDAKKKLIEVFSKNEDAFADLFFAVKEKFSGKYF